MIIRTTAGGMKGSLDDEFYTYFYVNEELCKMLGYTYDEFMEMSHGTVLLLAQSIHLIYLLL